MDSSDITPTIRYFQTRLLLRIMVIIAILATFGAVYAHRHLSKIARQEIRDSIENHMSQENATRQARHNALSEICDRLSKKARIVAAIEDDAIELLYPSAADEFRHFFKIEVNAPTDYNSSYPTYASFYRFLDREGKLIPPPNTTKSGYLDANTERKLEHPISKSANRIGYIQNHDKSGKPSVLEVFSLPIRSTEFSETIAYIVVGFPLQLEKVEKTTPNLRTAIWTQNNLIGGSIDQDLRKRIAPLISKQISEQTTERPENATFKAAGNSYQLDLRRLNPDSNYPPAYEVLLASMEALSKAQSDARMQIFATAAILFTLGYILSYPIAKRISRPVEELAIASQEEHSQRIIAETALDLSQQELERAARFSADASHQLKTPVTVMKAGLEELLEDPQLAESLKPEIYDLIHQTGRLSNVIEDLLLLSRMDAGRLQLQLKPVNLKTIVEELADDISILPNAETLTLQLDFDKESTVEGDRGYTSLILQNLFENAVKYNHPNGRIHISVTSNKPFTILTVGNTGASIPADKQSHIFERFNRGDFGENISGYGLGLNLSYELARLHGGSLRLLNSNDDWTQFELALKSTAGHPNDSIETV